jgi:hypothetical protein
VKHVLDAEDACQNDIIFYCFPTDYIHEEAPLDEKRDLSGETSLTFQRPTSSFFEQTRAQLFL